MPQTLSRWLPLALLAAAAFCWRGWDLAARPMHADEANQAVKAGELLESGRYAYDPRDHHGPVLYYAVLPVAWLRGQRTLAGLDEVTVRMVPVVAGTAAVVLLGLLAAPLGRWPSLGAAALLAASPPAFYYSRYFVQETLLCAFTLGAFVCARLWWRSGRLGWAVAAGACLGLMQAAKESAPLFALAGLAALLAAGVRPGPAAAGRRVRDALACAAAAVAVAALFYSSFGAHMSGMGDALRAYRGAAARLASGATGHEKPWWYYLVLLSWQRSGGVMFEQTWLATFALVGAAVAVSRGNPLMRWAAAYSAIVLFALSVTPYKTPWLAIHLAPGLAILAAGAVAALARSGGQAAAVILVILGFQAFQCDRVARVYASDPRNPYAYVHSSPDVLKYRAMADRALGRAPGGAVLVISEEYWPLPWYLRGLPGVGYWNSPPAVCDGAMVVASAGLADAVEARLHGPYDRAYLGLRPGFACVVFTPRR